MQAFEASKAPAAKRSAADTPAVDTTPRLIQVFRGYPPVSGLTPGGVPGYVIQAGETDGNPIQENPVTPDTGYQVRWIPPMGYSDTSKAPSASVPDSTVPYTIPLLPLPAGVSALQIVTQEAYRAHIVIVDYRGEDIRAFDQEFGYRGEFDNPQRAATKGLVSFLVWDNQDEAGVDAPDGVYLWKVRLAFESGAIEDRTQLTGLLGPACRAELGGP